MKTEFEVKIIDINIDDITQALEKAGAKYVGVKNQRRYIYDFNPAQENAWIRLRDTGREVELTIKEIHSTNIDGVKELEVQVSDFESTHQILQKLGYTPRAYQENKRTSYTLDGTKIEIDQWPQIPAYLEVEGESEEEVYEALKKLDIQKSATTSVSTKEIYKIYGIDIDQVSELKF